MIDPGLEQILALAFRVAGQEDAVFIDIGKLAHKTEFCDLQINGDIRQSPAHVFCLNPGGKGGDLRQQPVKGQLTRGAQHPSALGLEPAEGC